MQPIVLNARAAARPRLGGVERWAREVLQRLVQVEGRPPGAGRTAGDGARAPYRLARPPKALVHRAGQAWEQLALPARAAALRAELVFCPANLGPLAWPRNVLVVHDAAALREPRWYSPAYVAWQRRVLPLLVRRAVHVLTVSEFSRREIAELTGISPQRVTVVGGGVDPRFGVPGDPELARAALGLDGPYVLTVGGATARKNLESLDLAARRLRSAGVEIVVAGGGGPHLRSGPRPGLLRHVGYVAEAYLPALYAGASAYVLPSHHEGFGLTCLEAMTAGTPVVAARRGALPETCGEAALLVDPDDPGEVAGALERLLADAELSARLVAAGRRRAREFTWERTAAAVDGLLQEPARRAL